MGGRGGGGVGRRWPPVVEREPEGAERSGRDFFVQASSVQTACVTRLCKQIVQGAGQAAEQLSEVCFSQESEKERERGERRQGESHESLF